MQITLKLYATLGDFLPPQARKQTILVDVPTDTTAAELIDRCKIPREKAHLVLLNGIYIAPAERQKKTLANGDTLAVWPPIAGG